MKANGFFSSNPGRPSKSFPSRGQSSLIAALIYLLGALLGFAFNGLAVIADLNGAGFWGDFADAVAFDHDQPTRAELVKIRCPILLAPGEEAAITAVFQNPYPEKATILVKAVVSQDDTNHYRAVTANLPLAPAERQDFRWQVGRADIINRNFILTRVFLMNQERIIPYPARTDSCGIFVLSLFGLNGSALVALFMGTSLLSLAAGSVLINRSGSPIQNTSPRLDYGLYGLAGLLLVGMLANLLGWWIFAGLILVLAVLLTGILIPNMLFLSGSS